MSTKSDNTTIPKVLGICGGIGSGKSSACRALVDELGCLAHIDSDRVAHTIYDDDDNEALTDVIKAFGTSILTEGQQLDRKKLGSIVFADPNAMRQLERIVWPHVQTKLHKEIARLQAEWKDANDDDDDTRRKKIPIIVLEAAVLLDAGWQDSVDAVWVVSVPRHVALQRLQDTRGLSAEEAAKRINAQESRRGIGNVKEEVSKGVVTAVIENDKEMKDMVAELQRKINDPTAWYATTKASTI